MKVSEVPEAVRFMPDWLCNATWALGMDMSISDVKSNWNQANHSIDTEILFRDDGKTMRMEIQFSDTDANEELVKHSVKLCFEDYNKEKA